ncbi:MAG: EAL domain-containing protein [Chloroflexi bacterium]|nr:EAL domain-containing protein [Chloroflexota bacterium]
MQEARGAGSALADLHRTGDMIREALEAARIRLFMQPMFEVRSRRAVRHEVFVTLVDSAGKVRFPAEFIPQAEALDLIQVIDQKVAELAIQRWRTYADRGHNLKLSINVAAKSVDAEVARFIAGEAKRRGVPPGALSAEYNENAMMVRSRDMHAFCQTLKAAGIEVGVDDFGSGIASMSMLRNLPINYVKIDGSLIMNLGPSAPDRALVQAIVGITKSRGVATCAEFVQDEETMKALQELGVDYAQGFHLGMREEFPEQPAQVAQT